MVIGKVNKMLVPFPYFLVERLEDKNGFTINWATERTNTKTNKNQQTCAKENAENKQKDSLSIRDKGGHIYKTNS